MFDVYDTIHVLLFMRAIMRTTNWLNPMGLLTTTMTKMRKTGKGQISQHDTFMRNSFLILSKRKAIMLLIIPEVHGVEVERRLRTQQLETCINGMVFINMKNNETWSYMCADHRTLTQYGMVHKKSIKFTINWEVVSIASLVWKVSCVLPNFNGCTRMKTNFRLNKTFNTQHRISSYTNN